MFCFVFRFSFFVLCTYTSREMVGSVNNDVPMIPFVLGTPFVKINLFKKI